LGIEKNPLIQILYKGNSWFDMIDCIFN